MVIFYALVALCFSSGALAQIAGWGGCPNVQAMKDFNIREMQGRWFEARRYFLISETPLKCIKSDLLHGGGPGIILQNTTAISRLSGKMLSIKGIKIRVADSSEPSKLEVQMPSSSVWHPYWILGSDYHNYIVGYSCVDLKLINLQYLWIGTRQQQPSKSVIDKAVKVMEKQNLNAKKLIVTDQTKCDANADSKESSNVSDEEQNEEKKYMFY